MNVKSLAFLVVGCLILSGCDSFTAEPYGVSPDNDIALKKMAPANVTVTSLVATPDIQDKDFTCRLVGPISFPNDVKPADYISKAFVDELNLAGLSSGSQPTVMLSGQITQLDFSSWGNWNIGMTLKSSNGRTLSVSESYGFHASYSGDAACHDVADAFEPAVQALIGKLISDPGFPSLIKNPAAVPTS